MNKAFKNFGGSNGFVRVWTIFQEHLKRKPPLGGEEDVIAKVVKALLY